MKVTNRKSIKTSTHLSRGTTFSREVLPILEIMPYKQITKEGYLLDRFDQYQAYLSVKTVDLKNMKAEDKERMKLRLTALCSVYTEPFKILSMSYLTDTSSQQSFWQKKLQNSQKEMVTSSNIKAQRMKQILANDQLRYSSWVENNLLELTYFIIVYGKSKNELSKNIGEMVRLGDDEFAITHVKARKKLEQILFGLQNLNTPLNMKKQGKEEVSK